LSLIHFAFLGTYPPPSWCYAGVIIINCHRLLMLHQYSFHEVHVLSLLVFSSNSLLM
jgi:hypothetical protein